MMNPARSQRPVLLQALAQLSSASFRTIFGSISGKFCNHAFVSALGRTSRIFPFHPVHQRPESIQPSQPTSQYPQTCSNPSIHHLPPSSAPIPSALPHSKSSCSIVNQVHGELLSSLSSLSRDRHKDNLALCIALHLPTSPATF